MKLIVAITIGLLAVLIIFGGCNASNAGIVVSDAWVQLSPLPDRPAAAYLMLQNNTAQDDVLMSVDTDIAAASEVHESREESGVVRMVHLKQLDLPSGARIDLQPGGMHIMLIDLTRPLEQGDEVSITLTFANAGSIQVHAQVRES